MIILDSGTDSIHICPMSEGATLNILPEAVQKARKRRNNRYNLTLCIDEGVCPTCSEELYARFTDASLNIELYCKACDFTHEYPQGSAGGHDLTRDALGASSTNSGT